MKHQLPGLSATAVDSAVGLPDGIFLVRVAGAQYRFHRFKPFYVLRFSVTEPKPFAGLPIIGRLYCTPNAMWKLGWFLRDFLYDPELLNRDELDEQSLRGLTGVVKISHVVRNGVSLVNFDAFAPAGQWKELSSASRVPQATTAVRLVRREGKAR